jgi:hypothetical protein
MSDIILDTLKVSQNPPSRAQIEKKELPTSGTPMSDFVIDGLKRMGTPSRAQLDVKTSPQSNTPMSDLILDTLKVS